LAPILCGLFGAALALIRAGRRCRMGVEPHCRTCDYLLHGLPGDRCPECGTVLSPATIVYGEKRRGPLMVAGWVVLGLSIVIAAVAAVAVIPQVDWYQYEPGFFVLRDLHCGKAVTMERAWKELVRRDAAKSLGASVRNELVTFALAQEANARQPWVPLDTDTINYLGARYAAGDLPAEQAKKFFEQMTHTQVIVRDKVLEGDPVPYRESHTGIGPSGRILWRKITPVSVSVDGIRIEGAGGGYSSGSGFDSGWMDTTIPPQPPGKHEMAATVTVEVFQGQPGVTPGNSIYHGDQTTTAPFEVLATRPDNFLTPVSDPKLVPLVQAAMVVQSMRFVSTNHNLLECQIQVNSAPTDLAFDVFASYGGVERSLGSLTVAQGGTTSYGVSGDDNPLPPAAVDIILRPSEKAARNSVMLKSYWNQEVVIQNVPVSVH
jgi:hypothetical protein